MRRGALAVCLLFASGASAQNLEIHYINVGWGGSVLVKGPNGTTVLLEAGNTGKGTNKVVPYLESIGLPPAAGLDYTIAGHQHCDHIGGMDEVVQAGYDVRVRNYYNGSSYSSTCADGWNAASATTTAGVPVVPISGEEILLGDGARLYFVAVNGSIAGGGSVAVSDENDRSIAALVQYGGFDWLWASDMGGGSDACTGRSTTQTDVETSVITAISPGGAFPLISSQGIDVLHVNHHGSESSSNQNWMNLSRPAVAVISTGAGQSSGWDLPRIDVVEHVLLAQSTSCITVPPALVLQTEEGSPTGSLTSFAGYSVGDIKFVTDGVSGFTVSADGAVTEGPNEVAAAGLPTTYSLDDGAPPPNQPPTVATPAAASPNPVTGTTAALSVLGSDDGGEAALTYTWSGASFNPNGTNAAKNTTATFAAPGTYTLTVTIADGGGLTATSSVDVVVNSTLTTIAVSPASASVPRGASQQFTASAADQFGAPVGATFAWTATGGTITQDGLFTAGNRKGSFTVTASAGGRSGTASVRVR